MSLVQQVAVPRVSSLPQQVLLIGSLSEASISESLDIMVLHLLLQLPQAPGEVRAEAVLDIVTNLQVGGSPLDVVFMSGF